MEVLLYTVLTLCVLGILAALILYFVAQKFKVEEDPRIDEVEKMLPGANCGGCGFPGCDGLASAIAAGTAAVNACPVGGPAVADKIAAIMGVEGGASEKKVAFVKCKGTCDKTRVQYNYFGIDDLSLIHI